MKKTNFGLILGLTSTLATLTTISPAHSLTWTLNASVSDPGPPILNNLLIEGSFDIDNESLGQNATISNISILFDGVTYDNNSFVILGGTGEISDIGFTLAGGINGCQDPVSCSLDLVFSPGLTTAGGFIPLNVANFAQISNSGNISPTPNTTFSGGITGSAVVPFEFREGLVSLLGIGMIGASHWWRNRKKK